MGEGLKDSDRHAPSEVGSIKPSSSTLANTMSSFFLDTVSSHQESACYTACQLIKALKTSEFWLSHFAYSAGGKAKKTFFFLARGLARCVLQVALTAARRQISQVCPIERGGREAREKRSF